MGIEYSSDYDYDEVVIILADTHPTARIQHKCCECHGPIFPTEKYHSERGIFDGHFVIYKTCTLCQEVKAWVTTHARGFRPCYTQLIEEAEDCMHGHEFFQEFEEKLNTIRQRRIPA